MESILEGLNSDERSWFASAMRACELLARLVGQQKEKEASTWMGVQWLSLADELHDLSFGA